MSTNISAEIFQTINREGATTYIYNYAGGQLIFGDLSEAINTAVTAGYKPYSFNKDIISFIKY